MSALSRQHTASPDALPAATPSLRQEAAVRVELRDRSPQGELELHWKSETGSPLVSQRLLAKDELGQAELSRLASIATTKGVSADAAAELLRSAEQHSNLLVTTSAHKELLDATAGELLQLVDGEVYFVPPAKARDAMLGTLTSGALLSTRTLPQEQGNWALASLDVVGLRQVDRATGDRVLGAIPALAQKHFGENLRLFVRDGGDEFVFLLRAPESGASEALSYQMERFKEDLRAVRDNALAELPPPRVAAAVRSTLMLNAFRQDLQSWRDSLPEDLDRADPKRRMSGFVEFLTERYPELRSVAPQRHWPALPNEQEGVLFGFLNQVLGPQLHYFKIAGELARQHNPLLDVRASLTLFDGVPTPEVIQEVRAQNNFEIDRLKNRADAPVAVGSRGLPSTGEPRTFVRRANEVELATAIAASDETFASAREQLRSAAAQGKSDKDVFDIACRLARATCQDAQNPAGSRLRLGEHLLVGHVFGFRDSAVLRGIGINLLDASAVNNWLSPERFDNIFRRCCAATLIARERSDERTLRIGGGEAIQLRAHQGRIPDIEQLQRTVQHSYHDEVWKDQERQRQRLDIPARIARLASMVLSAQKGGPVAIERAIDFPRAQVRGPLELRMHAAQTLADISVGYRENLS